jgi:hypothetical protein
MTRRLVPIPLAGLGWPAASSNPGIFEIDRIELVP